MPNVQRKKRNRPGPLNWAMEFVRTALMRETQVFLDERDSECGPRAPCGAGFLKEPEARLEVAREPVESEPVLYVLSCWMVHNRYIWAQGSRLKDDLFGLPDPHDLLI